MPIVKGFTTKIEMNPNTDYKEKVFKMLHAMKAGDEFDVAASVKEENRKTFISCVCEFIDYDKARDKKHYIEISNGYAKIRKLTYSDVLFTEVESPATVADVSAASAQLAKIRFWVLNQDFKKKTLKNGCEEITDLKKFFESHISICENSLGKKSCEPYFFRLVEIYNILNK